MKLLSLFVLSFFIAIFCSNAQVHGDSATVAGGNFDDSRSRHFWMGSNYRKEWNTPITVPVLNLSKEHGGLTPVKRGGGKQTKSLRLEAPDGTQYTIRSITKYITSKTLPGDLQSEAAADLVSDGVSASYPYAAVSMTVLSQAAGVPTGNPKVVYIGDDPSLGEFREEFKNMLVLYEERYPESVKKGYDTDEVVEKLKEDNDNNVDQLAMLRVRILDMFVMDLDRHEDQWNWGATDNGKGKTFYPIAKDRDQAFYINRGLLPGFVKGRSLVPQLEGFKPKAKNIQRFNFAARNLDRFFLNGLSKEDWQKEADNFLAKMTDDVIDRAIAQQPKEIRDISGPWIAQTLKERRNYLVADVMEYYTFLANTVSIIASDKTDQVSINRQDDGWMTVTVNKITKEGNVTAKMFERKFDPFITKEVRIYGFANDDKFIVTGSNDKIKTRLIGGDGADAFESTERDAGIVYDRNDQNNTLAKGFKDKMKNDTISNSYERLYYKYPYQAFFVTVGYNPDDGFMIGPTLKYIRHGFRKTPYKSMHQLKTLFSFSTQAFRLTYNNEFIGIFGRKTDITTEVDYRGPNNTINFFGYGMNSVYDKTKKGKFKYYRVRYDLGDISLMLRHRFSEKVMLWLGPNYQFYSYDSTDKFNRVRAVESLTPPAGITSSINNNQSYFGVRTMLTVDTRNNRVLPRKGIFWNTSFRYLSGSNSKSYDKVSQLNSEFAFYVGLAKDWLVFANRTGFGATLADGMKFEFYQAQFLGSNEDLRGYRRERFAGKSKFFNQAELRWKWANLKTYLFPAAIGMFAFVDVGRVWVDNDNVNKMATGYGGGIWFSPLRKLVVNVSYAVSSEDKIPLVGVQWKF
ncbi:MAG TPA: hypothetical protein VMZ03_01995 [Chitinophagaceae bacterium]|nr:hypothetical protein [Chitinophagaceae bacterium]